MFGNGNARILVGENMILPYIAPLLNTLHVEKPEVFRHSLNVAYLTAEIYLRNYIGDLSLGIEKSGIKNIIQGALLHDIGKLKIDNKVFYKESKLTKEEQDLLKKHPQYGYEMIKEDPNISEETKEIVLCHHERLDGCGYPNQKKDLSHSIRLVNLCDRYDAMTENRPYRPKKDIYTALRILKEEINSAKIESDLDILLLLASIDER